MSEKELEKDEKNAPVKDAEKAESGRDKPGFADADQPEQITFDDQPDEPSADDEEYDDDPENDEIEYEYEDDEYGDDTDADIGSPVEKKQDHHQDEIYAGDDEYITADGVRLSDDGLVLPGDDGHAIGKRISNRVADSFLVYWLGNFFLWLFHKIRYSFASFLMSTNQWIKGRFDNALIKRFLNSSTISARMFKFKRAVARLLAQSYFISGRSGIGGMLLRTPVRRISGFLLSAGGGTIALYMANLFVFKVFNVPTSQLYVGILLCIPAIGMLAYGGTVLELIRSSRIMHTVVFGFFNADIKLDDESPIEGYTSATLLAGFATASLSLLVPLYEIIILLAVVICVAVVLKSPEVGVVSLIFILPFVDFMFVAALMTVVWISFALKFFCGKRVVNYEYVDSFPLVLLVLFLLGGIVSVGGGSLTALIPAGAISLYFLVAGIIRDSVWAKRCRAAFAIDVAILSAFAILRIIPGNPLGIDMVFSGRSDMGDSTGSAVMESGVLAIILGMLVMFLVSGIFSEKGKGAKFWFAFLSVASVVAMALSTYYLTFIVFFGLLLVLLLLISKRFWVLLLASFVFFVFMPIFGLPSIGDIFAQTEQALFLKTYLWKECLGFSPEIFLSGIGADPKAFDSVYNGVRNVSDPKNLVLSLLISYGVCGIVFFGMVVFFFVQYCFTHGRSCSNKRTPSRLYTYAGLCAAMLPVILGATENVFYNYRVSAMFWLIMGFTVSVQRCNAREFSHDYLDDPNIVPEI